MNRATIKENARSTRERLGILPESSHPAVSGALDLCDEIQYGLIWSRGVLPLEDRLVAALAVCCQKSLHDPLERLGEAAVKNGLTPQAVVEVCLQTGIYSGFAATESALKRLSRILPRSAPGGGPNGKDPNELTGFSKLGARTRERLHGIRHTDGYADPSHPFASPLYAIASDYGYGLIWNRPGLALRQRLVCALSALSALPDAGSFRKFAQAAVSNGISLAEVVEIIMQTAPYAGFPSALDSLVALGEIYPEHDLSAAAQTAPILKDAAM